MGTSNYTRRFGERLINYVFPNPIFTKNSMTIARDVDGNITSVTITDSIVTKVLTFTRDGNGRIIGVDVT